jgi:undecaprenyl-diphosphatase
MELIKKIVVGIIIYAVISAMLIIFLDQAIALDNAWFVLINSVSNPFLDSFFFIVTYLGSSVFWILMIILFWMEKQKKASVYLMIMFVIDSLTSLFLKYFFFRPRPYDTMPVKFLGFDVELGTSFPSGHTQRAFSGAVILGTLYKKYRLPLFVLALLVGISRIYIGVHYPLDTLVGAMNGLLFGMIALNLPYKPILKRLENL